MKKLLIVVYLFVQLVSFSVAEPLVLGAYYLSPTATIAADAPSPADHKKQVKVVCFVKNTTNKPVRFALNKRQILGPYFSGGKISAVNVLLRLEKSTDAYLGVVARSRSTIDWWELNPGEVGLIFEGMFTHDGTSALSDKITVSISIDQDYARELGSAVISQETVAVEPLKLVSIWGETAPPSKNPFETGP